MFQRLQTNKGNQWIFNKLVRNKQWLIRLTVNVYFLNPFHFKPASKAWYTSVVLWTRIPWSRDVLGNLRVALIIEKCSAFMEPKVNKSLPLYLTLSQWVAHLITLISLTSIWTAVYPVSKVLLHTQALQLKLSCVVSVPPPTFSPPSFDNPNNICRRVQIMNIVTMKVSPASSLPRLVQTSSIPLITLFSNVHLTNHIKMKQYDK